MYQLLSVKICSSCHLEKSLSDFGRSKDVKGGHIRQCRECIDNKAREGWVWIKCECGCGTDIKSIDARGHPARFAVGHAKSSVIE